MFVVEKGRADLSTMYKFDNAGTSCPMVGEDKGKDKEEFA